MDSLKTIFIREHTEINELCKLCFYSLRNWGVTTPWLLIIMWATIYSNSNTPYNIHNNTHTSLQDNSVCLYILHKREATIWDNTVWVRTCCTLFGYVYSRASSLKWGWQAVSQWRYLAQEKCYEELGLIMYRHSGICATWLYSRGPCATQCWKLHVVNIELLMMIQRRLEMF